MKMIKRINDVLAGLPMTIAGGVFLVLSFVSARLPIALPVDPAWVSVIICGIPLLYLAIYRIIYNPGISKISSALLISIAMLAAVAIGDLFAAGEVAFIMEIGAILEDRTTERAKKGLKNLIGLAPVQGRRRKDGKEEMIPADAIRKGDILRVLPGEAIPVDGKIISGETSVDQSIMTGESLPVDKSRGDEVFCGTINCYGAIDVEALRVGEDGSLQKMIRMVQEAEKKQAPMQRIADRAASWLVPVAMMIAIIAGIVTQDIVRAVTVLVVFCPCALVLATPTAVMAAIGQATKHGVVIKSGEALERMGKVRVIAFDKTGTLTYGKLEVCDIVPTDPAAGREKLLRLTAAAEAKSEHPLAKAIAAYTEKQKLEIPESASFQMQSGKGITATVDGKRLYCGNERYLEENGVFVDRSVTELLRQFRQQGKASVITACGNHCLGVIALSDVLREEAGRMVQSLAKLKTDTVLLTGDHRKTAEYFAKKAGITNIHAELLPEEKVAQIEEFEKNGQEVCMIGDGVNDAPALKIASVGVAMGSMGSDTAIEAADIALMRDDLSQIPYLKWLSDATVATIKGSITLSMCINFVAVTCSVLGILNPTTGALVHNAGSCFVVLIAALLYDRKYKE